MNILVVNFEMDIESPVLSWQHQVVNELAKHFSNVIVLTSRIGKVNLQSNVTLYKTPTILSRFPVRYFGTRWLANILAWKVCKKHNIHKCFIHMAMEWVYRLKPTFYFFKIPILLWYAHGSVTLRLKLAHKISDRVISSTKSGFRLKSDKLHIIGQGIDTKLFSIGSKPKDKYLIISVGRISERKRIDLLLGVMRKLIKLHPQRNYRLRLVGGTLTRKDQEYLQRTKQLIEKMGLTNKIEFSGHINRESLPEEYQKAGLQVNVSNTGSMDKTVLEGLACGCPILTSNVAFKQMLSGKLKKLFIEKIDKDDIVNRIEEICNGDVHYSDKYLRSIVIKNHDMKSYIEKVVKNIKEIG